jgi:L-ascorbate metabolism protein UlaG (beta-lactamase superfamily)
MMAGSEKEGDMRIWALAALFAVAALTAAPAAAAEPEPARCPVPAEWAPPEAPPRLLPVAPPGAPTLTARFMGVSTILFDDGETGFLIDGFFSRPNVWRLLNRPIEPSRRRIDNALDRAGFTANGRRRLAAVVVAQSHHDHAMDSAEVARLTGATLFGSASTANIGCGAGLTGQRNRIFRDGDSFTVGRFTVTVIKSPHSRPLPFPGEIRRPLRPPAQVTAYREGGNFSFLIEHGARRILVHPSANFSAGAMARYPANVVFLGIGGLGRPFALSTDAYWRELVLGTQAQLVVPIHWDNFFRRLGLPLRPVLGACRALTRLAGLASDSAGKVSLRLLPAFETLDLSAAAVPPGPATVDPFDPCRPRSAAAAAAPR